MSALEVIEQIKALPPEERKQVARFIVEEDDSWIPDELKHVATDGEAATETEAVKTELLRRQQEYYDHPERFAPMDEENLRALFSRIANARTRLSSARRS